MKLDVVRLVRIVIALGLSLVLLLAVTVTGLRLLTWGASSSVIMLCFLILVTGFAGLLFWVVEGWEA